MAAVAESSLNLAADKGAPGQAQQQQEVSDLRRNFNYPLVKVSRFTEGFERFSDNLCLLLR
jgi:hypothetical protein